MIIIKFIAFILVLLFVCLGGIMVSIFMVVYISDWWDRLKEKHENLRKRRSRRDN